jgi:hypothetical protein
MGIGIKRFIVLFLSSYQMYNIKANGITMRVGNLHRLDQEGQAHETFE